MFDEKFWVAVSFAILVAALFKPIMRFVLQATDARTKRIKEELDRAVQLREEAQAILASYQRKQQEALNNAGEIVAQAKATAGYMVEKAREELEEALNRRVEAAMHKIAQHETAVLQELKSNTMNLALNAVHRVILEDSSKGATDETVKQSVEELRKKFH